MLNKNHMALWRNSKQFTQTNIIDEKCWAHTKNTCLPWCSVELSNWCRDLKPVRTHTHKSSDLLIQAEHVNLSSTLFEYKSWTRIRHHSFGIKCFVANVNIMTTHLLLSWLIVFSECSSWIDKFQIKDSTMNNVYLERE